MKPFLFVFSFVLISSTIKAQVTQYDAINTIANDVVGIDSLEIHHLFSKYEKMYQGDTLWLEGMVEYYLAPYEENWVFFVDLMPVAFWAHPCYIIFFNAENGDYTINNDEWPPAPFLTGSTQFFEEWEWIQTVGSKPNQTNIKVFNIYPNPFSDKISIEFKNFNKRVLKARIIDISGKIVFSQEKTISSESVSPTIINTKTLKPGLYFIQLSDENEILYSGKIVK